MSAKIRLSALREKMQEKGIAAYIIPSQDPHMSEYVAPRWASRAYISGFDGSAGTAVITTDKAGLWTDSRYFLQASEQLAGSGIELFKMGLAETPSIAEWLKQVLPAGSKVGFDGSVFPHSEVISYGNAFEVKDLSLIGDFDLMDDVNPDRPSLPTEQIYEQELKYAGKSRTEKLSQVREAMTKNEADYHVITTLDDIAWLFNLRGSDVGFNPVFYAYSLISKDAAELFIKLDKVPDEVKSSLESDGVTISDYDDIFSRLSSIESGKSVLLDDAKINEKLYSSINSEARIINGKTISTLLKARKNSTEISGMKNAMKRDGIAMVKFLKWLDENVGEETITELSAAEKLRSLREELPLFVGESFNAISGYAEHGAIVHYAANEETQSELKPEGFYLIDSGGQYRDGTTDITRTVYLGEKPTAEEKRDYTLVLKGHIQLAMQKFPSGTRGSQLDILARQYMWNEGINYGHGTGHGVGCFMNVHEGPQSIRMDENPTPLEEGMILSNEPGIYRAGKHGIRIENIIVTTKDKTTDFGDFYKFKTITLCPIDTKAVDAKMMTAEEKAWLNDYHRWVYIDLSLNLDDAEKAWLTEKTHSIL